MGIARGKYDRLTNLYANQRSSAVLKRLRGEQKFIRPNGSLSPLIVFVGYLGKWSEEILDLPDTSIDPEKCYFTDPFKHKLEREPSEEELTTALRYVEDEIGILKPKVVVPVGQICTDLFIEGECVSNVAGHVYDWETHWLIPIQYPAAIAFDRGAVQLLHEDIELIAQYTRKKK